MDPTDTVAANKSIYMAPSPIPPSPAPSSSSDDKKALDYDFDPVIPEEEREFYRKAYPTIEVVRDRKVHCTVCKTHIGTAPVQEENIKMHPILRVTHCIKCHDFYNSGEFSKGEDGSELYCRWCGQGGEVYCCSSCPYVFCKACIMKNLSRGVVADIEQNENWSCFSCAPKILWPLRGQHWALKKYIDKQKRAIESMGVPEDEKIQLMSKDRSTCCRIAKSKAGNMSDSMESIDSITSRRSHGSSSSAKKKVPTYARATPSPLPPAPKKQKTNDEVVCTPDLMSMLEPDCQITVSKPRPTPPPITSVPKIMSIQPGYNRPPPAPVPQRTNVAPPPLVFRNGVQPRNIAPSPNVVRRTYVSPRPSTPGNTTPVYHTINGYCIDLNTAAQQETFRLPNGKLIQVKRQGTQIQSPIPNNNPWQYPRPQHNPPVTIRNTPIALPPQHQMQNYPIQQQNINNPVPPLAVQSPRYRNPTMVGNTTVTPIGVQQLQLINGNLQVAPQNAPPVPKTVLVRQVFSDTPIGQVRSQLQDKIFNAMEICQHLSTKVQTLTNSNAYKQARSYMEIKELYIHLSYLITYGIGRFKGLQDKCLNDMREMGFSNDADSLESGQLPAGVDYVRYGQLDDVDLFNTGSNSFHNQVYKYRVSLHENEEAEDGIKEPLSPLMPLGGIDTEYIDDDVEEILDDDWPKKIEKFEDTQPSYNWDRDEYEKENDPEEITCIDDDDQDEVEFDDEPGVSNNSYGMQYDQSNYATPRRGTEEYMNREENSFAFDRKLARLIQQYPAIWCTRSPDYGNFEVTRKQWCSIASHFKRNEHHKIKLRWKNIRKRYVRIERRIQEGKRFNGYLDKSISFLANRDRDLTQWEPVDVGNENEDEIEKKERITFYKEEEVEEEDETKPLEIRPLDMRIINFVKCNPILWTRSTDLAIDKLDEKSRKNLWKHFCKSVPNVKCEDIMDRWTHLYEMYKTFRLKSIKDNKSLANLELKYSKYLAKLYFLYKIDENELTYEDAIFEDCGDLSEWVPDESERKLHEMPDDKEFVLQLVRLVQCYPAIWDDTEDSYYNMHVRDQCWETIESKLQHFGRDLKTIKFRWELAKCCYYRLRRERRHLSTESQLYKFCKTLPADEMSFL